MCRAVILAIKHSMTYSHEALVGVKCNLEREGLSGQAFTLGVLWGGVVVKHQMHIAPHGHTSYPNV